MTIQGCRKVSVLPKIVPAAARKSRLKSQQGFTLIDILFVIGLLGLLASLAIPMLTRAKGAAQASSALATMRVVNSAQLSYAITCGLGFYAPDLPTLGVVPPNSSDAFLTEDLTSAATVIKSGFSFTVVATPLAGAPATCNGLGADQAAPSYVAFADPLDPQFMPRFFATNADGLIYEHTSSLNGLMPESGVPPSGAPIQ